MKIGLTPFSPFSIIFHFLLLIAPISEVLSATEVAPPSPFNLVEYLAEVEEANDGLKAARQRTQAFREQASERALLLSPALVGHWNYFNDSKLNGNPSMQGTQTMANSYSLGISQLTTLGTKARLAYELNQTKIEGSNPSFIPVPDYYEARPVLEISQPLWRNFFGSETRAQLNAIEAKALAASYSESYRWKQIRASAENIYWRARLAKLTVELRKETLERALHLRDWAAKRVASELADKSDLLQAESALKGKKLELQKAEDDSRSAFRAFNSMRGRDSDEVSETFAAASPEDINNLAMPVRAALRDDTKAAEQMNRVNTSNAQINREKGMPSLEAMASMAFNGRSAELGQSMSDSFQSDHPTFMVGLQLNAPLGWSAAKRLREGGEHEKLAAELEWKRKVFEQDSEWKDLTQKFAGAKERLQLARAFEESERETVKHERDRLQKGRSTTFQVLLFEQDFANSKLMRLQSEAEVFELYARLKTFE